MAKFAVCLECCAYLKEHHPQEYMSFIQFCHMDATFGYPYGNCDSEHFALIVLESLGFIMTADTSEINSCVRVKLLSAEKEGMKYFCSSLGKKGGLHSTPTKGVAINEQQT